MDFSSGNAAITLRSRLKVKVVKDMLQRTGREPAQQPQEHNGILTHGHSEAGKVTLQLQVREMDLRSTSDQPTILLHFMSVCLNLGQISRPI